MEISELTLKLILLLIPGSIACILYERLTIHKSWNSFKFITNSILFGAVSYLLAQLIFDICRNDNSFESFWQNLPSKEIPYNIIIKTSIISVVVGILATAIDQYKIINRIGKYLKLTNKYGDENLYSYFLNAQDVDEIYVRDIENKLTYHGLVNSFAENDSTNEIVLIDVIVYDYETSAQLYILDKIYLSRSRNNLIIELPYKNNKDGKTTNSETSE